MQREHQFKIQEEEMMDHKQTFCSSMMCSNRMERQMVSAQELNLI
jgi:hypothetical protein